MTQQVPGGGPPTAGSGRGAPNPSTAQARVLLDELARCGVRHVVVCPGSRSTALAVAADAHPALRTHVALDERGAGLLAVGVGRATGQPAVVVVTSGTAVANLHPAVVEADHDRVPLLLLTADRPPELHGVGANQTIEQIGIFGASTRWTVDVGVAGDGAEEVARWRWIACRAHGTAVGRPVEVPNVVSLDAWQAPGPVHLDVPFREPTVPSSDDGRSAARPFRHALDGRADGGPWRTSEVEPHVPVGHVVRDLERRLVSRPHGVVVVGGAVPGGVGPLLEVAATLGWPVLAEPHAPVPAVDEGGPLAHPSLLLTDPGFVAAHAPEVVLRVGRPTISREVQRLVDDVPELVVVDLHGGWVDHDDPRATVVRGAVGSTMHELRVARSRHRDDRRNDSWLASWRAADEVAARVVAAELGASPGPSEPGVVRTVLGTVPPGTPVVVGSSMPIRDAELVGAPVDRTTVHANRGASGIDGTVATALGVALGSGRPTVAVMGDLTLLHDQTAWLLREDERGARADLVVVVLDNDGGGIFSFLPQRHHVERFERLFGTPHGIDLADLATLHRLGYVAPDTLADDRAVGEVVRERLAVGGRHLVHVRTEREANLTLHQRLRAAVVEALGEAELH